MAEASEYRQLVGRLPNVAGLAMGFMTRDIAAGWQGLPNEPPAFSLGTAGGVMSGGVTTTPAAQGRLAADSKG